MEHILSAIPYSRQWGYSKQLITQFTMNYKYEKHYKEVYIDCCECVLGIDLGWREGLWKPCMHAQSLQSCMTLFSPVDCILPWVLPCKNTGKGCMPSSRGLSQPRDLPDPGNYVSCAGRGVLYH